LIEVYRHWGRISKLENPTAYVNRILVNLNISWRRRLTTTEIPVSAFKVTSGRVADPADEVAAQDEVRAMFSKLSPRARTVLVLRYYLDMDDATIAEMIGVKASSVRATASRALACLREFAKDGEMRELL
jgi:RNA polymerase sigma factor (sigma-70 family)